MNCCGCYSVLYMLENMNNCRGNMPGWHRGYTYIRPIGMMNNFYNMYCNRCLNKNHHIQPIRRNHISPPAPLRNILFSYYMFYQVYNQYQMCIQYSLILQCRVGMCGLSGHNIHQIHIGCRADRMRQSMRMPVLILLPAPRTKTQPEPPAVS